MLDQIIALVKAYRYWAIVPFALFEAPLMSIVIGFFAATGDLNLFRAFGIVVLGDSIGDTVLYIFGRWLRPRLERMGLHLNISAGRVQRVLDYFGKRDRRAIVISKLVHGVGFTGLVVAGSIRVPYRRFIATCIIVTVSQSAILAVAGILAGRAYQSVAQWLGYLDFVVAALALVGLFFAYRALISKIDDHNPAD